MAAEEEAFQTFSIFSLRFLEPEKSSIFSRVVDASNATAHTFTFTRYLGGGLCGSEFFLLTETHANAVSFHSSFRRSCSGRPGEEVSEGGRANGTADFEANDAPFHAA